MTSIPPIEESLEVLESLLRQEKQAVRKQRLHLLVLLKQGTLTTWQAIAQQLAVHRNTLRTWVAAYQSGGLEKLLQMDARGAPKGQRSLSTEVIEAIKQRLEDPAGVSGYVELHLWLIDEHQVQIPYKTLYHIVRYQLKAKLKVPRAKHTKRDDKQITQFQEDLPEQLETATSDKPYPNVRVMLQDESRLGLMTIPQRRLTLTGIKPIQTVYPRYESYYLYGAIEPLTGDKFFLELPTLDSDCFQCFIDLLAATAPNDLLVLLLDNGSFHKAERLVIPENMAFIFLPPYSPELNPIERFWQHIKAKVGFILHQTLDALKDAVAEQLKRCTKQFITSLTFYPYLRKAINAL